MQHFAWPLLAPVSARADMMYVPRLPEPEAPPSNAPAYALVLIIIGALAARELHRRKPPK